MQMWYSCWLFTSQQCGLKVFQVCQVRTTPLTHAYQLNTTHTGHASHTMWSKGQCSAQIPSRCVVPLTTQLLYCPVKRLSNARDLLLTPHLKVPSKTKQYIQPKQNSLLAWCALIGAIVVICFLQSDISTPMPWPLSSEIYILSVPL